jgi:hypothetical protein
MIIASSESFTDSCQVQNGGCECNSLCSHHPVTNAVKCTCRTGYVNSGTVDKVVCVGMFETFTRVYNCPVCFPHTCNCR